MKEYVEAAPRSDLEQLRIMLAWIVGLRLLSLLALRYVNYQKR